MNLKWRQGRGFGWLQFVSLAAAVYISLLRAYIPLSMAEQQEDDFGRDHDQTSYSQGSYSSHAVQRAIVHLWFGAVIALTIRVNWSLLVEKYTNWQNQHGTFRII